MPQATEELRAKMRERFGGIDDQTAWDFLTVPWLHDGPFLDQTSEPAA